MCYFNGQKVSKAEYIRLQELVKLVANYSFLNLDVINGFDFGNTAVLKPIPDKEDFEIVEMEWGFLPDPGIWPFIETREQATKIRIRHQDHKGQWQEGFNFLNAKGEELLFKNKVYRKSALEKRCLILSTGYYEWRHVFEKNKRTGEPKKTSIKYPYRVMIKSKEYFYMAAIWNEWTDYVTGETIDTVSMVTTDANEITSQIHNSKSRQPTILTDDLAFEWMFSKPDEKRITEIATFQLPWQEFSWYTLAKDFLSSNDPLKEFKYANLAPIILPGMDDMKEEPLTLFS